MKLIFSKAVNWHYKCVAEVLPESLCDLVKVV